MEKDKNINVKMATVTMISTTKRTSRLSTLPIAFRSNSQGILNGQSPGASTCRNGIKPLLHTLLARIL